jgi:hypothetical protein
MYIYLSTQFTNVVLIVGMIHHGRQWLSEMGPPTEQKF